MHVLMPYVVIHVVVFAARRCTAQAVAEAIPTTMDQGFIQDFYHNKGKTAFLFTNETDLMVLWTIWELTEVPQAE